MEFLTAVTAANDSAQATADSLQAAYDTATKSDPMAALMISDLMDRQSQINTRLSLIAKAART